MRLVLWRSITDSWYNWVQNISAAVEQKINVHARTEILPFSDRSLNWLHLYCSQTFSVGGFGVTTGSRTAPNIFRCNSQDLFWHFLYYRTKKVSEAICEDTQLFSLSQPDEPITCSSGCIFPVSCNWYLLATSIPSRKVCMGVFPKQYFPECVLCVL